MAAGRCSGSWKEGDIEIFARSGVRGKILIEH